MKTALLLLAFIPQVSSPDGPATVTNPQFPIHVQVLATKADNTRIGARGMGRGNILGDTVKGIDFAYDCAEPILNTGPAEFYQARWKKQDQKLELLMQRIGSDHLDKCTIAITYKPAPYALPKK
jgi:hypothetical protein